MRVLITGARAPVAIEWASIFNRQGHQVFMTDSLSYPLGSFLKYVERYIKTSSPRFAHESYQNDILKIIDTYGIDMVIPTCEEVFFLAELAKQNPSIDWLLPEAELLFRLHNKLKVFDVLQGLPGVRLPKTKLVTSNDDVIIDNTTILKPLYSRFGNQVIRNLSQKSVAEIEITTDIPWVQQQKIDGQPICNYALFEEGVLKVHQAYLPKYCVNNSAATAFLPIYDQVIERFMIEFGQRYCFHGQVSFDFIQSTNGLYVIECNPRATSGLHIVAPYCKTSRPYFTFNVPKINKLHHLGTTTLIAAGILSLFSPRVWRDYARGMNTIKCHRKYLLPHAQICSLFELCKIAKKQRISLSQATTYDIEWNDKAQDL